MTAPHYDVVVIGAGLSGLAAGLRLAYFGRRVLVLERHSVWGGLNSFYKKGGHHFDTGLHAVTNWLRPGYRGPRVPMQRVLRQLRLGLDELALEPQTVSDVSVGGVCLRFTNDLADLEAEVRAKFPAEIDGFRRLAERCRDYPEMASDTPYVSARAVVASYVSDPLLRELVLLPIFFYGTAEEDDIDFDQFVILFNSIFREGFSRPRRGVRQILDLLLARLEEAGGQLRRNAGVERLTVRDGRVREVVLEGGEVITADVVISSAGLVETMRLRSDLPADTHAADLGQLAFVETIWVVDTPPAALGHDTCISFFSEDAPVAWRAPKPAVDLRSGVLCCPSSYRHAEPLEEHLVRATHLARPDLWLSFGEEEYAAEKAKFVAGSLDVVSRRMSANLARHVTFTDAFTPRTVKRFTAKENGAIYGSPHKRKSGRTDLANLFLCGTDQGMPGIVGSMLSGIAMANAHGMGTQGGHE